MNTVLIHICGVFAGITALIAFIPQIYQVYTTQSVQDLSVWMVINFLVCSASWIAYGIWIHAPYIICTNSASAFFKCILIAQIIWCKKYKFL